MQAGNQDSALGLNYPRSGAGAWSWRQNLTLEFSPTSFGGEELRQERGQVAIQVQESGLNLTGSAARWRAFWPRKIVEFGTELAVVFPYQHPRHF